MKVEINNIFKDNKSIYFIILCCIFISDSINIELYNLNPKIILISDSEITLIIKGKGTQQILNDRNIALYDSTS